jgi:hypothetical protein
MTVDRATSTEDLVEIKKSKDFSHSYDVGNNSHSLISVHFASSALGDAGPSQSVFVGPDQSKLKSPDSRIIPTASVTLSAFHPASNDHFRSKLSGSQNPILDIFHEFRDVLPPIIQSQLLCCAARRLTLLFNKSLPEQLQASSSAPAPLAGDAIIIKNVFSEMEISLAEIDWKTSLGIEAVTACEAMLTSLLTLKHEPIVTLQSSLELLHWYVLQYIPISIHTFHMHV